MTTDERGESRFGVRRRVKSVLERAKNRTGIRNNSDAIQTSRDASIVAETASIGGWDISPTATSTDVDMGVSLNYNTPPSSKPASSSSPKKTPVNGASTYSEPKSTYQPYPEERLGTTTPSDVNGATDNDSNKKSFNELDALRADVSAAFSMPYSPLPFTLPQLTPQQKKLVHMGERVQEQSDMGREGSGFVVWDVKAPTDVVWDCLLDFHSYPETIPTVRGVTMYTNTHLGSDYRSETPTSSSSGTMTPVTLQHGIPSVTRASFTLSKFRLNIAAIHKYRPHPDGDYMVFTLDPACTNLVLKSAKGVWHTEANPDNKGEEYTRVWLLCEVKVSRALPSWITDYAAKRAMPRATTWLKPQVETAASLWLKKKQEGDSSSNTSSSK
jgi:hypothetical protein